MNHQRIMNLSAHLTRLTLLATGLAALAAHGATSPSPDSPSAGGLVSTNLWPLLIPAVVPVVIAGIKWLLPKIPPVCLPILAPLLGAALEIVLHYSGLVNGTGALGALLGAAGVGLREVLDQVKKLNAAKP